MRAKIIFFLLFITSELTAQNELSSWEETLEQLASEGGNWQNDIEDWEETKEHLKESPLNINTATKQDWEGFPFLTPKQIEEILFYLYRFKEMKSVSDLLLVEEMDIDTYHLLAPYVCVQPIPKKEMPTLKEIGKYGKHLILARGDIPLYQREAYKIPEKVLPSDINKYYLGPGWSHSLRYQFHYGNKVYAGITADKDAGEQFFGKGTHGYDYYSLYFFLQNIGRLKSLALGNYRAGFGLGLVMSNDFLMGKSTSLSTLCNRSGGFKKHSSTDEFNYFRGGAVCYELFKSFAISAFYSHRDLDGILSKDTLTSIQEGGTHRTYRELERKNVVTEQMFGTHLEYVNNGLRLGVTALYYFFDRLYYRPIRNYNRYYFRGQSNSNYGVNYRYRFHRFSFEGETAVSENGAIATLNVLNYTPLKPYRFTLLHRYYDKKYQAEFARSFSEGGDVQNENGVYVGMETSLIHHIKLSGYIDVFQFPWVKYGVDAPSSGFDGQLQGIYHPKHSLQLTVRYRFREKGKNQTIADQPKMINAFLQHRIRVQCDWTPNKTYALRTLIDVNKCGFGQGSQSSGFQWMGSGSVKCPHLPLSFDALVSFFATDDYESRVTLYEKGPLYAFSFPSFYGRGEHYMGIIRYDISDHLMVLGKFSQTIYQDRDHISSGIDLIEGNKKSDLQVQLRYQF